MELSDKEYGVGVMAYPVSPEKSLHGPARRTWSEQLRAGDQWVSPRSEAQTLAVPGF